LDFHHVFDFGHADSWWFYSQTHQPLQQYGGEPRSSDKSQSVSNVNSSCTEVCNSYSGKSCAKILQVNVFQKDNPSETHKMYAIIDDQSNRSLASPAFFDMFNILDKPENYTLSTCSGIIATSGRRGRGFVVESVHRDINTCFSNDYPAEFKLLCIRVPV
jgi:hypothetical protein